MCVAVTWAGAGADGAATCVCPRRPLAVSTPPSARLCGQAAVTCQEWPHRPHEDKEMALQRGPAGLTAPLLASRQP